MKNQLIVKLNEKEASGFENTFPPIYVDRF